MTTAISVAREAIASARSGPVASVLTVLMVAGMIVAVMLTTGRTVGAEQRVLGSIDSAGTRTILVRAETEAGVTSDVLDRIAGIQGIEWAGAFSSAVDGTNSQIPDGTPVPIRYAYGAQLERLGVPTQMPISSELVYASPVAIDQLGLADTTGGVALRTGIVYGLGGGITTPEFMASFEPLALIPQPNATGLEPVNLVLVVASRPDLVAPVADAVTSVLAVVDPSRVTVQTSENLAQLRSLVQGQLVSFSRGLVLALLGLTGGLVAALMYGLVMLRRKDFGRRRALGASRSLIISLLLTQTAILAVIGIAVGVTAALLILIATGDPLPSGSFIAGLGILTLVTGVLAVLIPAAVASRREPIRELRVP